MTILSDMRGYKEMLMRRTFLAIVSSIIVQCFFVICMILVTTLSIDITSWLQDAKKAVTNIQTWSYIVILATITSSQGIICSKKYLSGPTCPKSRFSRFQHLFTIENLLIALVYMTVGGILVRIHLLSTEGIYSSSIKTCDTLPGICLVEEYYFLLFAGVWAGITSFCKTYVLNANYPIFSAVPQSKFCQLERGIYAMIPSALVISLQSTLYFIITYYFVGSKFRSIILWLKPVQMEKEPLNSLSMLLNPSLMLHVWLCHSIYTLSIRSMYLLFKVHFTEWVPFEMHQTSVFDTATGGLSLTKALSMSDMPILQHLAFLDLCVIAQKDKSRRRALFTLSEPGGYPYNWNCMIENCKNLLKKFTESLDEALQKSKEQRSSLSPTALTSSACSGLLPSLPSLKSLSSSPPPVATAATAAAAGAGTQLPPPLGPPLPSLSSSVNEQFKQRGSAYRMRSLLIVEEPDPNVSAVSAKQFPSCETFTQKFKNCISQIVSTSGPYRTVKRVLAYAFDDIEDNKKVRYLLLNGQTVIWCVEAISSLSVLSLEEDAYGMAQRDLPVIINTLLQLKQSLEKLQKSNLLPRKQQGEDRVVKQMFFSLRSAAKRSIYKIATNFKSYIEDVSLEPGCVEQLQNFLQYKE